MKKQAAILILFILLNISCEDQEMIYILHYLILVFMIIVISLESKAVMLFISQRALEKAMI